MLTYTGCTTSQPLSPSVTTEPPGANCAAGGVKIQVGDETPRFVCNGAQGDQGEKGAEGNLGQPGVSVSVTPEAAGTNCQHGGAKLQVGTSPATYVCAGAPGKDGSTVEVAPELPGVNCPAGGVSVKVGTADPTYVCNGESGQGVAVTPLPSGDANCALGGVSVQVGTGGTPSYVCNGAPGDAGANGLSPTLTTLPAGDTNCPYGGLSVQVGTGTPAYACNGAPGDAGANGSNGLSPTLTTLPAGDTNCPYGGFSIQVGTGTPAYACNGAPGDAGANGSNGLTPTVTPVPVGNANCPYGGFSIQVGTGTPAYACNGAPGVAGTAGANALVREVARYEVTTECPYGGLFIYFGTDDNRNNTLDLPGEIDATHTTCFAIDQDGDGDNFGADNCPGVANANQSDLDGDAIGDLCDPTPCPVSLTFCSATCQNLQTSATACGSCTNTCSGGANATATCTSGSCGLSCNTGFLNCDSNATNGCELDGRSDNNNCGACNNVCAGGSTCIEGACTVSLYVAPTGDDTTGTGTDTAPYATIGKGLTAAAAVASPARVAVKVQQGTYSIAAQLTVPSRTRLMGGYATGDWTSRNPTTNATIVDSTAVLTGSAIVASSGGLGVDGVQVRNTAVSTDFTTNHQKRCFDLSLANGAALVDSACTIQSCGYNDSCFAVLLGSNARAEHNVIRIQGGTGTNSSAYAILVQGSGTITLRRNAVFNNYSGRYNYGIKVSSNGSAATLKLENNLVDANVTFTGNGGNTVEFDPLPSGSSISVRNNTIRGGAANAGSAFYSLIIKPQTTPVTIENNLLFTVGSAVASNGCLSVPASFTSLRNNNLFDCGGRLVNNGSDQTTLTAVNALTNAGANLSFDMVTGANAYFVNETNDFSLKTGGTGDFVTVKTGGLDLSSSFTVDLNGTSRTGASGTGWSMGAYEQDN